jgi:hypothetical protein
MNAVDTIRWRPRKWVFAIGVVFILQVVLVSIFGERRAMRPPGQPRRPAIFLDGGPLATEQIAHLPLLSDPAALALPNPNGFSRGGWLEFSHPEFRLAEWSESPQWLTLDSGELGLSFRRFVETNIMPALRIADKPLPRMRRPNAPVVGNARVRMQSELQVQGELAEWTMVDQLDQPSWAHTDPLTNTVVEAVVDSHGQVVATTLLSGCGLAQADQFAVRAATSARFLPPVGRAVSSAPPSTIAVGKLVFKWHTLPAATNVISASPGPITRPPAPPP